MLTLSDLIRKGAVGKVQIFGSLSDSKEGVCALGAAIQGLKEAGLVDSDDA